MCVCVPLPPTGIQFSYPTLASGRRIMIHVSTERGMWSFLEPFEPSLWLAYFATSVFVGLLLLVVETPGRNLRRSKPLVVRGANMQWGALGTLLRITTQVGGQAHTHTHMYTRAPSQRCLVCCVYTRTHACHGGLEQRTAEAC